MNERRAPRSTRSGGLMNRTESSHSTTWSRRITPIVIAIALGAAFLVTAPAWATSSRLHHAHVTTTGQRLPGTPCPAFPADNVWNTPITQLPVDAQSATWLTSMNAATTNLHPDYGPSSDPKSPYGIPWTVVAPRTVFTSIHFLYATESDRRPYPLSATTRIEGGSDRHAIMVDPMKSATSPACTLFEIYDAHYHAAGRSTAGSGAVWNLTSNALRPAGFTSADAAGLPILPGLVNFDEVASGAMDHAIRFTAECTQRDYLWPARHEAGVENSNCPPMGARFRLNASFALPTTRCSSFCQTVLTTMKTYGLILADNGSNWYFQGTADTRWTDSEVDQLKLIPASQFVAVDESCLMIQPNSAQALQPGTTAFAQKCG